jgi:hypothetical protein
MNNETNEFDRLEFLLTCLPKQGDYDFIQLPRDFALNLLQVYRHLAQRYEANTDRMNEYSAEIKEYQVKDKDYPRNFTPENTP